MGKVIAAITTSVDGYVVGPQDGPEHGLGVGGERLHYWVMGGPWTYADHADPNGMQGADRDYYEALIDGVRSGIVGRNMYEAAGAWGGSDGSVSLGGGADLIRQGLRAGVVDELGISTTPVVLGRGKLLFDGFDQDLDLEILGTWSFRYATHVRYAVQRP